MYQVGEPVKLMTMSEQEFKVQKAIAFREGATRALGEVQAILASLKLQTLPTHGVEINAFLTGRNDAVVIVDRTIDILLCSYEEDDDSDDSDDDDDDADDDECCGDDACPWHTDADADADDDDPDEPESSEDDLGTPFAF